MVTNVYVACHEFHLSETENSPCKWVDFLKFVVSQSTCWYVIPKVHQLRGLFMQSEPSFVPGLGSYTRAFDDGPLNFEPWLSDLATPKLASLLVTGTSHQRDDVSASTYLRCISLLCKAGLLGSNS
ncbi:hypothetical protein TNCV_2184631 [Trichonephila clavipes]|nr:hypothetical protein TNCV_2184631 [Trichonephila clavipes]